MRPFLFIGAAYGLNQEEISKFRCRGENNAQFHQRQVANSQQINEQASQSNGFNGCMGTSTCWKTQNTCNVGVHVNGGTLTFTSNSIADHHSWAVSNQEIVPQHYQVRFPTNPRLLTIAESYKQSVKEGEIGFAINGVALQNPYHTNTCCDATMERVEAADACNGDTRKSGGGRYSYQFWGATKDYSGCAMSCSDREISDIVGVALDGFAIYGPMQMYSPSEKKIYNDPRRCSDCDIVQLNGDHLDKCGGIEVADGDANFGGQYRYIATASFPYYLQCYRGDINDGRNEYYQDGNWQPFSKVYNAAKKCDVNDFGFNEECWILDQSYAEGQLCALGNCNVDRVDLSDVYFTCSDTPGKRDLEGCGSVVTTRDPGTENTGRPTRETRPTKGGTKGTDGTQGTRPTRSSKGTDGTQGTRPTRSSKGTDGTQGTRPTRSSKGTDGTQGTRPTRSSQGTDGTQGTRPTRSSKGTDGTQGTRPTRSSKGTDGTQGTRPTRSSKGTDGTQGTRPTRSSMGTDGTQGTDGTVGPTVDPSTVQWNGEWTSELLGLFYCRSGNFWQKDDACRAENCKTGHDCSVGSRMNGQEWELTSNGIADHNVCHEITTRGYRSRIPTKPQLRSGDPSSYPATNMGVIGYAFNGVPFFSGYDSKCCDAGLYELWGLDMCYAHPARQGNYHYHLYNECVQPCTGVSQMMGVALDGFPIMGPGINPETQMPWCQSDMDICGGRLDENGNYAYFMTPDFPYSFQCYAGTPLDNVDLSGSCGFYGENCDWEPRPGNERVRREVGSRYERAIEDPTSEWFNKAMALYESRGQHGSYFSGMFGEVHNRHRRSDANKMYNDIDAFLKKETNRPPWQGMSVEDFMHHLVYDCDPCLGVRELSETCSGIRHNTCTGETCEICQSLNADPSCNDNCQFEWKSTTGGPTQSTERTTQPTQSTDGTQPTQSTDGTMSTRSTQGTDNTRPTRSSKGTDGTRPTRSSKGTDGTRPTRSSKGTDGTRPTQSTQGTDGTMSTKSTQGTDGTDGTRPTRSSKGTDGTRPTRSSKGTDGTRPTRSSKGTDGTRPTQSTKGTDGTMSTKSTQGTDGTRSTDPTTEGEWPGEWTDEWIAKFNCRFGNFWQKEEDCTSSDCISNHDCQVSVSASGDYWQLSSNGIPDHNTCRAIAPRTYNVRIPQKPVKKAGDQTTFDPANMGVIGYAINGVPLFSGYDSKCCDAGLYELVGLDLCYAHPAQQANYHYHVYSECVTQCTGKSQLYGVALDGFPIMGPGINPATNMPWCQSDMDHCGGREDENGNYAYYVTPDFPYTFQCYAGTPLERTPPGKCGWYGENCDWSVRPGLQGSAGSTGNRRGARSAIGEVGLPWVNRQRREVDDPTSRWFMNALALFEERGEHGAYFEGRFGEVHSRKRRGLKSDMEKYVQKFLDDNDDNGRVPWLGMTVDDFLVHLMYECDGCMGRRELSDECTGIRSNECTGETCTICPAKNAPDGCKNDCDFNWVSSTVAPTTEVTKTEKTKTDGTKSTKGPTTKSTKPATTLGPDDKKCLVSDLPEGVTVVDEGKGKNSDGSYKVDGYLSASCADGFVDSLNKPKVKHICQCTDTECTLTPAKDGWTCVDQKVCPLPFWGGNKFSYVKIVNDEWAQLKSRFKPDPNKGDTKFWKTADWTAVVVCNQDMRKANGADGVVALEMYPRSHSQDGRAWTLINRPGFHIAKRDKGVYYKIMVDSPVEKFGWEVGKTGQKTCWIGVIDGHWPNLAECLGEYYDNNGLRCSSCW